MSMKKKSLLLYYYRSGRTALSGLTDAVGVRVRISYDLALSVGAYREDVGT